MGKAFSYDSLQKKGSFYSVRGVSEKRSMDSERDSQSSLSKERILNDAKKWIEDRKRRHKMVHMANGEAGCGLGSGGGTLDTWGTLIKGGKG